MIIIIYLKVIHFQYKNYVIFFCLVSRENINTFLLLFFFFRRQKLLLLCKIIYFDTKNIVIVTLSSNQFILFMCLLQYLKPFLIIFVFKGLILKKVLNSTRWAGERQKQQNLTVNLLVFNVYSPDQSKLYYRSISLLFIKALKVSHPLP